MDLVLVGRKNQQTVSAQMVYKQNGNRTQKNWYLLLSALNVQPVLRQLLHPQSTRTDKPSVQASDTNVNNAKDYKLFYSKFILICLLSCVWQWLSKCCCYFITSLDLDRNLNFVKYSWHGDRISRSIEQKLLKSRPFDAIMSVRCVWSAWKQSRWPRR